MSNRELGWETNYDLAVMIMKREEVAQRLDDLVVKMKEAVAMDITIDNCYGGPPSKDICNICVSIYRPNNESISAARKERLRLSAISMSSEQSQTTTTATGDSVWLGIEPYTALYTHGDRSEFVFKVGTYAAPVSLVESFATDLGLSILRNAHSVQCLRVEVDGTTNTRRFAQKFFSLDAWKEAFPSLRSVYLGHEYGLDSIFDLPPHLLKHVRGLVVDVEGWQRFQCKEPAAVGQIESMIRNKEYGIEEVRFATWLLRQAELLDDTRRRVRSFRCFLESEEDVDLLAGSFERTKADGDNLVRLRFDDCRLLPRFSRAVERILRSRPNLQILNLGRKVSLSTFVVLCPVFASSILTTLKVSFPVQAAVEDKTSADGVEMLLQHPTIRDLHLTIDRETMFRPTSQMEGDSAYHFERCVAEGLRSTSLRRFHLTVKGFEEDYLSEIEPSITAITKMYENARENWSLMDIRLEGDGWYPPKKPAQPLPFPLSGFGFISLRNQYFSRVLMLDENTLPPGLWPLILELCASPLRSCKEWYNQSVLFYVLTLRPHLVKGKVESSIYADREKSVDVPLPKRTRIN